MDGFSRFNRGKSNYWFGLRRFVKFPQVDEGWGDGAGLSPYSGTKLLSGLQDAIDNPFPGRALFLLCFQQHRLLIFLRGALCRVSVLGYRVGSKYRLMRFQGHRNR